MCDVYNNKTKAGLVVDFQRLNSRRLVDMLR